LKLLSKKLGEIGPFWVIAWEQDCFALECIRIVFQVGVYLFFDVVILCVELVILGFFCVSKVLIGPWSPPPSLAFSSQVYAWGTTLDISRGHIGNVQGLSLTLGDCLNQCLRGLPDISQSLPSGLLSKVRYRHQQLLEVNLKPRTLQS
jgi:hypothetical protein